MQMNRASRCLLVTRIGPKSLHRGWIGSTATREFDVVLSAYDPSVVPVDADGVFFEFRPGYKVAGYSGFMNDQGDMWRQYEYVCFYDEDLEATTEGLNHMFRLCLEGNFKIAQAALTPDSHYTYAALVQQKAFRLRHVNFIEMMCPIFRSDILAKVEHLYHSKRETGIDIVWSQQVGTEERDFAVLDAAPLRHSEPVAAKLEENGFDRTTGYDADIDALLRHYKVPWLGCTPYSAIRPSGRCVRSKLLLFLAALPVVWSVPLQRPWSQRLKFVVVHLKHIAETAIGRVPGRPAAADDGAG